MKNILSANLIVLIILLHQGSSLQAHEGGHYHRRASEFLNTWQLKSGQTIKGNFSAGNESYILLEGYDGEKIKLGIAQLSEQDQLLARFKIKKLARLNQPVLLSVTRDPVAGKSEPETIWWLLSLLSAGIFLFLLVRFLFLIWHSAAGQLSFKTLFSYLLLMSLSAFACKKTTDSIIPAPSDVIPKSRTGFIDSAFAPYKPFIATSWDNNYFYVSSSGFPQHNMMVGITSWQQQVPVPQYYTGTNSWSIPLQPEYATVPMSTRTNFMKGAIAIAVNGIPIFNALNNRGADANAIGELDNWGGHCGRADDYHYHAAPLHLSALSGQMPIAFALDGFPVYGATEPDGSSMQALDTCHGHRVNNSVYHYHGTADYPYVVGAMRGKVMTDPTTPAPENQILPQAFASPVRPALTPLSGAVITLFQSAGVNAYKLTYQRGTKQGFVEYSWDPANNYTYKLIDTAGNVTVNVYQR